MSHYSLAFHPEELDKWARKAARSLKVRYDKYPNRYPSIVYRGMSGIVSATALMLALKRGNKLPFLRMTYIRKDGEDSHGIKVESKMVWGGYSSTHEMEKDVIFVDDFIQSGDTFLAAMGEYFTDGHTASITPIFTLLTGASDGEYQDRLRPIEKYYDEMVDLRGGLKIMFAQRDMERNEGND